MKRVINILLFLIIFTLPLGVLLRFGVGQNVSLNVLDCLVLLFDGISILYFRQKLFINQKKLLSAYIILMGSFSIGYSVSLSIPMQDLVVSLLYFVRFGVYLFLIFPLLYMKGEKGLIILRCMAISGLLFVIFGLLQYFLYPNLINLSYLGWDDHLFRVFSTFFDPNFAGIFIGLEILLLLYLYIASKKSNRIHIFLGLGILTSITAFFLTYSRSSYISLFVALLVFTGCIKRLRLTIIVFVIFIIAIFVIPKNLKSEGVNLFRIYSIESRSIEYAKAFKVFYKNPLIGTGFNTYRYIQIRNGLHTYTTREDHSGAGVPNSILLILATTGIVGLTAFIFYIGVLARTIIQPMRKNIPLFAFVFASTQIVLFGSVFENAFFYPYILVWIILVLGTVNRIEKKSK